ncbi:High-affinity glucose transporter like protein [Verticillium longisporum]|uniref:High-affinity glucose transporter like protein n=2 Tax=Verticillium longisporum TaxID=100787 RepID=A0A0G4LPP0_VERLO|nr:High-affinity glucose transporter like protein [Verticillium longisporum]KAG7137365.1 High-affinity glucose transporter like protein [Verticillium longisporum]CRK24012.1 hypothetical protein BN1708_003704 [Verticillium longisporum]
MALPPKVYQWLVGVFASLGSLTYGYDLGVIAQVIAAPSFLDRVGDNPAEIGGIVSVFTGGAFFGALAAAPMADRLGRKLCILIGAVVFIIGGLLQTLAKNTAYMMAGRGIGGLGIGAMVMIIPVYQAELAHPSIRGTVTALQQFMLGVGALFAAWFSYAMTVGVSDDNENQWRISLGLQNIPAGVLALLIMLFPESPRWLIDHGKAEDGLKTLAKLHSNGNVNDAWVQAEFAQIQESISVEHEVQAKSYMELFRDKSCLRRLWIACSVQASIQMTGVAAIQYYSVAIYSKMGISTNNTLMYQAISNILALCAQGLCMALVDRLGRRWPLILGNVGNCITFIISTALLASFPPDESGGNKAASWAFIVMTWIYNFSFSATCGPLSWIIPAEIFDMKTRAKGVSIATAVNLAFNAMIAQTTSVALDDNTGIGWRWYILFIVCNATNAIYFWCVLPETARRPLEEMRYLFTEAPYFVPTMNPSQAYSNDMELRLEQAERKQGGAADLEVEDVHSRV